MQLSNCLVIQSKLVITITMTCKMTQHVIDYEVRLGINKILFPGGSLLHESEYTSNCTSGTPICIASKILPVQCETLP